MPTYKIYVGCLPGEATEEKVKQIFGQYGEIKSVDLIKKKSNKCIGSGYVVCWNEATFNAILSSEVHYGNRKLETSKYLEREELQKLHEDINLRKVLVKNLPPKYSNIDLKRSFSIFGEILNAFISVDKNQKYNKPSNYGIVIFKTRLGAYKALNGKFLLKGNPVIVRLHRFKNVGEACYFVRGEKIKAKDLIDVQIGFTEKHDISDIMDGSYSNRVREFERKKDLYEELMRQDRKKLKKDCKRKKDSSLRKKLIEIEKDEQRVKKNGGRKKWNKKRENNNFDKKKKRGKRGEKIGNYEEEERGMGENGQRSNTQWTGGRGRGRGRGDRGKKQYNRSYERPQTTFNSNIEPRGEYYSGFQNFQNDNEYFDYFQESDNFYKRGGHYHNNYMDQRYHHRVEEPEKRYIYGSPEKTKRIRLEQEADKRRLNQTSNAQFEVYPEKNEINNGGNRLNLPEYSGRGKDLHSPKNFQDSAGFSYNINTIVSGDDDEIFDWSKASKSKTRSKGLHTPRNNIIETKEEKKTSGKNLRANFKNSVNKSSHELGKGIKVVKEINEEKMKIEINKGSKIYPKGKNIFDRFNFKFIFFSEKLKFNF